MYTNGIMIRILQMINMHHFGCIVDKDLHPYSLRLAIYKRKYTSNSLKTFMINLNYKEM